MLSDSKKRNQYDNGQDLDEMGSGMGHAGKYWFIFNGNFLIEIFLIYYDLLKDIDPNVLFQAFFGGGSPFMFSSGGGGRSRNPGGFQFSFG